MPTGASPTKTIVSPTEITLGETIIVASTADSGPGTLRQALQDAQPGDIITFDPAVFPLDSPQVIYVQTNLPGITQGNVTIDATNTGVILDGSKISDGFNVGIAAHSNNNIIRGLKVVGFSGAGLVVDYGQGNLIEKNVSCGNDYGVGLWGPDTIGNTIKDNFLGVQADGAMSQGNRSDGITIMEGANNNTIGPGNQIAFNERYGVQIYQPYTIGNRITQNSIHDNGQEGIHLSDSGNSEIPAPAIFDFDLSAGTISGNACPGCRIEIFSDTNNEGENYEGQTNADEEGRYSFEKGAPFTGQHLTATLTDTNGNTSQFSNLTSGSERTLVLQTGNDLPRTLFKSKRSNELEANRIGSVGMSDAPDPSGQLHDLPAIMEQVVSMGLQQFRFTIVNIDGTLVDWTRSEFTFTQRQRDFITAMDENGVKVTYLLHFRDDALGGESRPLRPRFKTEEEIQRYMDYVRFIIANVKGHVTYYEIWNEPDIADSVQWIEVEDYINLVRRVVPVIRQEDPQGKIMLAGTTYLFNPGSRNYFFSILKSDILPLVDVVSWHPMYGTSPEFDSEYYYNYPSLVQEIKDTASAHGFKGDYQASEIVWWTEAEAQEMEVWYSEIAAGKYHARGTLMNLGMDVSVTNAAIPSGYPSRHYVNTAISNLCTIMAGAKPTNLPVEIESKATNIKSYTFLLPNNEYLVAFWKDGVAVENDPGVNATLTLPNFSSEEVVGIDVLNSFEQQIISEDEDGDLVVRNLLVKDYPIILRVKKQ